MLFYFILFSIYFELKKLQIMYNINATEKPRANLYELSYILKTIIVIEKLIDMRSIIRTNKLKYVHLNILVKNTTKKSTTQSKLAECMFDKIYTDSH